MILLLELPIDPRATFFAVVPLGVSLPEFKIGTPRATTSESESLEILHGDPHSTMSRSLILLGAVGVSGLCSGFIWFGLMRLLVCLNLIGIELTVRHRAVRSEGVPRTRCTSSLDHRDSATTRSTVRDRRTLPFGTPT